MGPLHHGLHIGFWAKQLWTTLHHTPPQHMYGPLPLNTLTPTHTPRQTRQYTYACLHSCARTHTHTCTWTTSTYLLGELGCLDLHKSRLNCFQKTLGIAKCHSPWAYRHTGAHTILIPETQKHLHHTTQFTTSPHPHRLIHPHPHRSLHPHRHRSCKCKSQKAQI